MELGGGGGPQINEQKKFLAACKVKTNYRKDDLGDAKQTSLFFHLDHTTEQNL